MIPTENIFTIVVTIIYLLMYYKDWLFIFKHKETRMIIAIILSIITGFAWSFTAFNYRAICVADYLFLFLFGIAFSFILLNILWSDLTNVQIENINQQEGVAYTLENIIGVEGTIISNIQDNKYLGKLNDNVSSDILIVFEDNTNVNLGDKFTVDKIDEGTIYAKKV